MTWCDGCNKPHQQTSLWLTHDNHLNYLCTPCYQDADYWEDIRPRWRDDEGVAA